MLQATYACVARYGMAKTTVEDVAREARVSRATVYRYFPGGRDQLIADTVSWEVARFFSRLADAVAAAPDLSTLLVEGLMYAHRAIEDHEVLQKVLQTEPDRLLPSLTVAANRVLVLIRGFLVPYLERQPLREGLSVEEASDYLARMVLSFIGTQGATDLSDRPKVESLVRREFLAGLV
jgi:AcrR family transcriptional regulator